MSPRFALALVALPLLASAQSDQVAMAVASPSAARIAARPAVASAALASEGAATYQTFEMARARPGAGTRFAATCLGREDRVIGGSCVRRDAGGYVSFAGRTTTADGSEAVECALDGAQAASAVGIAICLDVPPLR